MAHDSLPSAELAFLSSVQDLYWSLISFADGGARSQAHRGLDPDLGRDLGGQLLYAGSLDGEGRALVVAANVAGAATLAAADDPAAQKRAIYDGVVDFAVTTLDEALRILKNQVRKHETVAVCVGANPAAVEADMQERGIVPDLVAGWHERHGNAAADFAGKAKRIGPLPVADGQAAITWSVAAAGTQWLPRLDALAAASLDSDAWVERRWLRLAPRFLGRMARGIHVLRCAPDAADAFVKRVELADLRCELGVPVEIEITRRGVSERHRFSPAGPPRNTR
jgi:Urocanase Rossmann-like domain